MDTWPPYQMVLTSSAYTSASCPPVPIGFDRFKCFLYEPSAFERTNEPGRPSVPSEPARSKRA